MVEDSDDRAALLGDFGIAARISPAGGTVDLLALLDGPTRELGGVAGELEFLEASPSLIVRTEELSGLRVLDGVEILEGSRAGLYVARSIVAEDDGEFTRIDIAEA